MRLPRRSCYPGRTDSGQPNDSYRFASVEAALFVIDREFPDKRREHAPSPAPTLEQWELERQSLMGRLHPIVPSLLALTAATRERTDSDRVSWALHDAWWWCNLHQLMNAPENAYLWGREIHRAQKANTAFEILFEAEVYGLLRDKWGSPPCLPPARDCPSPEFVFFLEEVGSVSVEAKCVAPLNEEEASTVVRLARVADRVLSCLADEKLPVWVTTDPVEARNLDSEGGEWLQEIMSAARTASDTKGPLASRLCSAQYLGPWMRCGTRGIPPSSLTLEGWWGDHSKFPLDDQLKPVFYCSPAEAKVTVEGAWPDPGKRVQNNLIRADKKHSSALGVTCVRIRPPPFAVVPDDLLQYLWDTVVLPTKEAGKLPNTRVVLLSLMLESRVHPTRIRRRYRQHEMEAIPIHVPTQVETLVGALDEAVPDHLLMALGGKVTQADPNS